jgi:hypothetical protein
MFNPKNFYQYFLVEYHKFKIISLKKILSDLPKYEKEFFGKELELEERNAYRQTLKSELRQAYFHSIETFFELFFALDPTHKTTFNDENILFDITNSNPKQTYERIQKIVKDKNALDFLDKEIKILNHEITIGHYIFYFVFFSNEKFSQRIYDEIKESIVAIKYGIKIIAKDFINREEYNCYKHGLRIIPAFKEFMVAQADNLENKFSWNLSDSMSFYNKTKNSNELKLTTKLFDSERDYLMSYFCSNLIFNMIYYRRVSLCKESIKEKEIPIPIFGIKEVKDCDKINVEIQDLVWTVTKNKSKV